MRAIFTRALAGIAAVFGMRGISLRPAEPDPPLPPPPAPAETPALHPRQAEANEGRAGRGKRSTVARDKRAATKARNRLAHR
jgi:hypothetical protein